MHGSGHRTYAGALADERRFDEHAHPGHELLWGVTGRFTVTTTENVWHVPPLMGLLVPAGVVHGGEGWAGTNYLTTVFDASQFACRSGGPVVVHVPAAARELLLLAMRPTQLRGDVQRRSGRLAYDLIEPAGAVTPPLPIPTDDRARVIAEALLRDPADGRTLTQWGRSVGASRRTLARLFPDETGSTFGQWRTHARISAAISLLADGRTVTEVARRVGYGSSSGFIRAFRQSTGGLPRSAEPPSPGPD